MSETPAKYGHHNLERMIVQVRGMPVILDADLARAYGVTTAALNQAVKRNRARFPSAFVLSLVPQEVAILISQFVISSFGPNQSQIETGSATDPTSNEDGMRSQTVTASKHGGRRKPTYAFTEHGAIMAAMVLNSPRAVQMSVFVVRAFIKMREQLLNRSEMEKRLAEIERGLMSHDVALRDLYAKIRPLLLPPPDPPNRPIGFSVRESRARYQVRMRKGK